jgi:DNA polymerase elongation subunit (family B)
MIISSTNDNKNIYSAWREDGIRKFKIENFQPYFFVEESHREIKSYKPTKYVKRDFVYEQGDWFSLDGKKLKKVYVENADDMRNAKDLFGKTYEADVRYHHRYAVDNLTEVPEYDLRKWYWDMEWQQGGEHDGNITTIVVYDNYDKRYTQWAWFPDEWEGHVKGQTIVYNEKTKHNIYYCPTEKQMLQSFMNNMINKDPDMLIAWFGLKFDLPKLLDRCCALGINPLLMSPIGKIDGVFPTKKGFKFTKADEGFSPISQPMGGRLTLNLDMAFERQWNDSQRGTLPSLALEYVSQTLFGEGKSKETIFQDPNEFYRRAWLEDTQNYLDYAVTDVELLVKIDETNYSSEAILALQRLLVAPFDACFYASHMGGIYFMRNASWKAPTGIRPKNKICSNCNKVNDKKAKTCTQCKESLSYQGAMVYDPLSESTNGLHYGVAAFDFAGLYPSMILARNISFETISETPTKLAANLATPKDFSISDEEDMVYFKTDKLGLLPTAVLELKELRNQYKAKMKEAKENNDGEYVKWYNNQMAVKRLSASFYGILAFAGFGWSNVTLAESITASAREAIRSAAFKAKELEA